MPRMGDVIARIALHGMLCLAGVFLSLRGVSNSVSV